MLSVKENEDLTRVGPGTPTGELLRRYWFPVAASSELVTTEPSGGLHRGGTKAVRLLGEDLVVFRDLKGRVGLIEPRCAHRRVNLVYGIAEEHTGPRARSAGCPPTWSRWITTMPATTAERRRSTA